MVLNSFSHVLKYIRIGVMIIKRPETVRLLGQLSQQHFYQTFLGHSALYTLYRHINYYWFIVKFNWLSTSDIVVIDGNGTSVRCLEGRKDWYIKVEPFQSIFPICSQSLPTTNQTTTFCIIHNTLFTIATKWNVRRNWFLKHFIVTSCLHLVERFR